MGKLVAVSRETLRITASLMSNYSMAVLEDWVALCVVEQPAMKAVIMMLEIRIFTMLTMPRSLTWCQVYRLQIEHQHSKMILYSAVRQYASVLF